MRRASGKTFRCGEGQLGAAVAACKLQECTHRSLTAQPYTQPPMVFEPYSASISPGHWCMQAAALMLAEAYTVSMEVPVTAAAIATAAAGAALNPGLPADSLSRHATWPLGPQTGYSALQCQPQYAVCTLVTKPLSRTPAITRGRVRCIVAQACAGPRGPAAALVRGELALRLGHADGMHAYTC